MGSQMVLTQEKQMWFVAEGQTVSPRTRRSPVPAEPGEAGSPSQCCPTRSRWPCSWGKREPHVGAAGEATAWLTRWPESPHPCLGRKRNES